jgi:Flp pilus assembly protein TadD
MKQRIRRLITPWVIAVLPLSGCASMNQQRSSIMPQWIAGSPNLDSKLAYGRLCERHGQTKQAQDIYQMLANTRNAPIKQSALHRLAVMSAKRGDYAEASERFAQATKVQSPSAELLNDMGYNYFLMDNLSEAEICYRRAIELDPQYTAAQNNLGLALGQQGKFDDAMKAFAKTGNDSQAHTNMAYVYAQHRYLDQARQHYLKALGHDEKNERAAEGLVQVAKAFDAAVQSQANKTAADKAVAKNEASAKMGKASELVAEVVTPSQPLTRVAAVAPSPAVTLPAPGADSKSVVSSRRSETRAVSPWANSTPAAEVAATPKVQTLAPTALAETKASADAVSQPLATIISDMPSVASAPVVPGISLPKPMPKATNSAVATQTPSAPSGVMWATKSTVAKNDLAQVTTPATQPAAKGELPRITLGQPASIPGAAPAPSNLSAAPNNSKPVAPSAPLWVTNPTTQSVAKTNSAPAAILPSTPVQVASPSPQSTRSAVVTAGHSEPSSNDRGSVNNASPNNMPELPVRLPVATSPTASAPSPLSNSQTQSAPVSVQPFPTTKAPEAERVGKKPVANNALMAGLVPKMPKPAEPVKIPNSSMSTSPLTSNDTVRPATYIDTKQAANTPAAVTPAPTTNSQPKPAQTESVTFPPAVAPLSVVPNGVKPVTPSLPSKPTSVAAPTLKTNVDPLQAKTNDRFAAMKAGKDKPMSPPIPSAVTSTTSSSTQIPNITPPNTTIPNVSQPNLALKPIHLEITGLPKNQSSPTAPAATAIAPQKNYLPKGDSYKVPAYKVPANEVPSLNGSYRSRGLGLDGTAGSGT